jgi:hypothetical protein
LCDDERNRELEKEKEILYKTAIKEEFHSKFDYIFNKSVDEYINDGHSFPLGFGRCLKNMKEYLKKNMWEE